MGYSQVLDKVRGVIEELTDYGMRLIYRLVIPVATKTAAYTATKSDGLILCDATAAAFTVTLPSAANIEGKALELVKIDSGANAVTVDGNGSETISGSANVSLASQWDVTVVRSDGTNWIKLV